MKLELIHAAIPHPDDATFSPVVDPWGNGRRRLYGRRGGGGRRMVCSLPNSYALSHGKDRASEKNYQKWT